MIRAPPFGLLCTKTYVRHVHEAVGLLPVRASCEVDSGLANTWIWRPYLIQYDTIRRAAVSVSYSFHRAVL